MCFFDEEVSSVGDKEWYFFCMRGRKYRNSIRPNRVTGSGFWKATGIDKPIYSVKQPICIGLKKSLVYYRGGAGKGTKTDWMMHEFRLRPNAKDDAQKAVSIFFFFSSNPHCKSLWIDLVMFHTPNQTMMITPALIYNI